VGIRRKLEKKSILSNFHISKVNDVNSLGGFMRAVLMAGGSGTRLRPLTCDLPKPMVPILNRPIAEHIINLHYEIISKMVATLGFK
jgi:mannose-1-phosphate guanylyltransferase / phosphomannomutase